MRKIVMVGLLSLASVMGITACGSNETSTNGTGPIVIGAIGPLTGSTAQYGDSMKKNIELYLDKINQSGGIGGRQIKLVFEDDAGEPNQGLNAVDRLINNDHAIAVLGSPLSGVDLAVMKETEKAKIPQIDTSGGNPKITSSGDPYIVRVVTKDSDIVNNVVQYAVNVKHFTKFGILHGSDEYGKGGEQPAIAALKKLGISSYDDESFNTGTTDFSAQLSKFKQDGVQAIIFWGYYQEGAMVAKQNKQLGLNAQIFAGTGINNPKFVTLAGDASEGVLMGTPFVATDPSIQDYVSSYKDKYGQTPDMTGACGYDGAQLIVAAIKAVGADSQKINDWLHNVKDLKGVTGTLTASPTGDLDNGAKIVQIHQDGSMNLVWSPDQSTK